MIDTNDDIFLESMIDDKFDKENLSIEKHIELVLLLDEYFNIKNKIINFNPND